MKKLIAIALVAVMLVAMSISVLANETVEAVPCGETSIFDGTVTEAEYGAPVAHISSDFAYDTDNCDDEIPGCQAFVYYQGVDPFAMDAYIYIAWYKQDASRLYFCADVALKDGKLHGAYNGLAGGDHWCNSAFQFRASADVAATDDDTIPNGDLWGSKTFNIIVAPYTADCPNGYLTDGAVIKSSANSDPASQNGAVFSACDHFAEEDRDYLLGASGAFAGSIGVHGSRVHYETILRTDKYWCEGTELAHLDIGDSFACSMAFFEDGCTDNWIGCITWGHGIVWMNSGYGKTGTNNVVIADTPAAPAQSTSGSSAAGDAGDALVVVVATAIMALGTAVIVKKVK